MVAITSAEPGGTHPAGRGISRDAQHGVLASLGAGLERDLFRSRLLHLRPVSRPCRNRQQLHLAARVTMPRTASTPGRVNSQAEITDYSNTKPMTAMRFKAACILIVHDIFSPFYQPCINVKLNKGKIGVNVKFTPVTTDPYKCTYP